MFPRWSPNGDKFAYNTIKEDDWILYSKSISSGKTRIISGRKGLNTGACCSNDGKSIDLALSNKGEQDIYSVALNGKILKRLTNNSSTNMSPSRSPDELKM